MQLANHAISTVEGEKDDMAIWSYFYLRAVWTLFLKQGCTCEDVNNFYNHLAHNYSTSKSQVLAGRSGQLPCIETPTPPASRRCLPHAAPSLPTRSMGRQRPTLGRWIDCQDAWLTVLHGESAMAICLMANRLGWGGAGGIEGEKWQERDAHSGLARMG